MDPYLVRFIREEIRRHMNIVLTGQSVNADTETTGLANYFSGSDPLTDVPVAHPYGFCSNALDGTFAVHVRVGEYSGNRLVILHRDNNRPADLDAGESVMYSATGHRFYAGTNGCYIGSKSAANPLVLGDTLQSYTDALYTAVQQLYNAVILGTTSLSTSAGNPSAPNPAVATDLTSKLATLTTKKAQLSDAPATNFQSLVNFTERGTPVQAVPVPVTTVPL